MPLWKYYEKDRESAIEKERESATDLFVNFSTNSLGWMSMYVKCVLHKQWKIEPSCKFYMCKCLSVSLQMFCNSFSFSFRQKTNEKILNICIECQIEDYGIARHALSHNKNRVAVDFNSNVWQKTKDTIPDLSIWNVIVQLLLLLLLLLSIHIKHNRTPFSIQFSKNRRI